MCDDLVTIVQKETTVEEYLSSDRGKFTLLVFVIDTSSLSPIHALKSLK